MEDSNTHLQSEDVFADVFIPRQKAIKLNANFKDFASEHFSKFIAKYFWDSLLIKREDIDKILAQKDIDGDKCEAIRIYPGLGPVDLNQPDIVPNSFALILVGVDKQGKNMFQTEIARAKDPDASLQGIQDLFSDEHEPCRPPNSCEGLDS